MILYSLTVNTLLSNPLYKRFPNSKVGILQNNAAIQFKGRSRR